MTVSVYIHCFPHTWRIFTPLQRNIKVINCEEVWSPAIASCPGGQDTVAGEKDVVVEVVVVDEVVELVVDGELDVVIAVVVLWVYLEVTTSGLSWR